MSIDGWITMWVVIGVIFTALVVAAYKQGCLRINNESKVRTLQVQLEIEKQQNRRLEIMKEALSDAQRKR